MVLVPNGYKVFPIIRLIGRNLDETVILDHIISGLFQTRDVWPFMTRKVDIILDSSFLGPSSVSRYTESLVRNMLPREIVLTGKSLVKWPIMPI